MKFFCGIPISGIKCYWDKFYFLSYTKHRCIPILLHKETIKRTQILRFCNTPLSSPDKWFRIIELNAEDFLTYITCVTDHSRLKTIMEEIKIAIEHKRRFPELINTGQLQELYNLETRTQRFQYLRYLFKREKIRLADAKRKEEKKIERENQRKETEKSLDADDLKYAGGKNRLLLNVRSRSMHKFHSKKLANAVLFGSKVILDLDYDKLMTEKEKSACVTQLRLVYSINRRNTDPFDLYFCNAVPTSNCIQYLKKDIPNLSDSLITITEQSYVNIFPKENLIYLSPHAKESLKEYDPTAIYIIGAFVDTVNKKHISLHKAESEGIKSYSLPLDDYIMWGIGTKSLTINQAFEIMLTLKNTGDWKKAFSCIPTRKIRKIEPSEAETQNLSNKIFLLNTSLNKAL